MAEGFLRLVNDFVDGSVGVLAVHVVEHERVHFFIRKPNAAAQRNCPAMEQRVLRQPSRIVFLMVWIVVAYHLAVFIYDPQL